ncbi:APC family permease [Aciditerrimonas ferrireducens]|uniref:APC family permease n=1 Tax=Aciditerrimonas ferrireducens TaxID=667306 RepID=A0ABV6C5N0_9ACTN
MASDVAAAVPSPGTPGAGTAEPLGSFEQADVHLRKSLGFTSLLFLSMGAIIGSGWLLAALAAASVAGPASILSWVIGGVFIIFIALSYAEISGMLPRSGAIVRYPQLTHGSATGWLMGWTYWLTALAVPAIEAEAVVTYVGGRYPSAGFEATRHGVVVLTGSGIGFAIGLMVLFAFVNFFGVRLLGEWNKWFTWWKIIIPTATFCMLFVAFRSSNFTGLQGGFFATGTANVFVALSTTGIIFAYLGFRQALDFAGESIRPARDVPLATILSIVLGMIIYALLQVGFIGALVWHKAGVHPGNWAGLASSSWASTPLYSALEAAGIGALATFASLLLYDAGISPSGTGWIYLGTATRTTYGLGVGRFGPKALTRHNRFGVPWLSLLIALVIGCVFFVPAPSWYKLVGFITSTTVLTYIMGGVGLPVLRRYAPNLHRPFRLRGAWFWAPVGFLAAVMIVFWTTYVTLADVYAAVFVGLPIFGWYYAAEHGWVDRPKIGVLGAVFLAAWIYIQFRGGWVMRVVTPVDPARHGFWSFATYDVASSACVAFYLVGLYLLANQEGRRHVRASVWLVVMMLALFPLEYWTADLGPHTTEPVSFTVGTIVAAAVGLVCYFWGVASGFSTPELQDILAGGGAQAATAVPPSPSPAETPAPAPAPATFSSPSPPAPEGA